MTFVSARQADLAGLLENFCGSLVRSSADTALHYAPGGLAAYYLAKLAQEKGVLLAVTPYEDPQLASTLRSYLPQAEIWEFPAWDTLPHEQLSPTPECVGKRLRVLQQLTARQAAASAAGEKQSDDPARPAGDPARPLVVIASVKALMQPIPADLKQPLQLEFRVGSGEISLQEISRQLLLMSYARTDLVNKRGEFAMRGGILDIYPPLEDNPVRIEFFGNTVDQLRHFRIADQRSLDSALSTLTLSANREMLLTDALRSRAAQAAQEFPDPHARQVLEKIANGIAVDGMEVFTGVLVDKLVSLLEFMPGDFTLAMVSSERCRQQAEQLTETDREFLEAAWNITAEGKTGADRSAQTAADRRSTVDPLVPGRLTAAPLSAWEYYSLPQLQELASRFGVTWVSLTDFAQDGSASAVNRDGSGLFGGRSLVSAGDHTSVDEVAVAPSFSGNLLAVADYLTELASQGWCAAAAAAGHTRKLFELLADRGCAVSFAEEAGKTGTAAACAKDMSAVANLPAAAPGGVVLFDSFIKEGFALPQKKFVLLGEQELWGKRGSRRYRPISRGVKTIDPLELSPGDYVVHNIHGVGRFIEMRSRTIKTAYGKPSIEREYLVLEYAPRRGHPPDKLYVPTDQLSMISKYVGSDAPALSKMGGSDWAITKSKAKKAVRQIAVDLVKLYSERKAVKGHSFAPDTPFQQELEETFPYAETPDQLKTIAEVKADMESDRPMDRLLSGDVGFGKTEVAIRAAFKAVQDNKQVAVLVPTTLLVRQHAQSFRERFAAFPVKVAALSRFQTKAEIDQILSGVASGEIDVVIGTHILLGERVSFKNLGLVVIDEEQRFGVDHKEALKKLKTGVDILAMSATPIPRTLEMAVTGIREVSTLATPPENRLPVLTYVGPYQDKQVAAAVRRELIREGQVFYVHNDTSTISRAAASLQELIPEARVAVAHGKLSEKTLEKTMIDFWERKYDILVCTTIIETGLDMANANTIIINRAQSYGLSQLHQLRGRVGRGRERAYAYLFYDDSKALTQTAYDRLLTIAKNNYLGSGTQIAMKDLELRGAGNLLGQAQSGHIAEVGFDLYIRMVSEAIAEFKGEAAAEETELRVELPVDARIPVDYIDSQRLRLEAYQKLAAAADDAAIERVREEFIDRYGALPSEMLTLLEITRLRLRCAEVGLTTVTVSGNTLTLAPVTELRQSRQLRLRMLHPQAVHKGNKLTLPLPPDTPAASAGIRGSLGAASLAADEPGVSRTSLTAANPAPSELPAWVMRIIEDLLACA